MTGTRVRRFDYGELGKAERTPQGFLKVPGFATRTGVFPYIDGDGTVRRELRHPDDVFDPKSLETLRYAPVTIEHPPEMLTPDNVAQYSKGHVTERVEVNREMVDVDLIIEHADAINEVEEGGLRELSSGYVSDVVPETGTYNGAPYNFRQKNIEYNHLAIVKRGRAGPEVRMRLDSADAVMRNDEVSVPPRGEFAEESSINDSDESTKKIVVVGQELELPNDIADTIQDMMDRYDEMRAKISELEECVKAKRADQNDVDINQKGVSPQVKVEQQIPDGKGAPGKTPPKPGTITGGPTEKSDDEEMDDDQMGVIGGMKKNSRDEDKMKKEDKEEKDDYEAESAGAGGGAAMSPIDQLKKDYEETKAKLDALTAKMDEEAAASMSKGEAKADRNDSVKAQIRARVNLERKAERLVPAEVAARFDSMTDDEIRKTVIKHKHPKFEPEGKSSVYLQSRFDSIVELDEEGDVGGREDIGRRMLGLERATERMDAAGEMNPNQARMKMINGSRELWKSDLTAKRKA